MKALNDRTTQAIEEITTLVGTSTQEITDLKENTITELDEKANQIKTDVETLNNYDTTNWQKSKITDDNGYIRMITSPDLSVTTLDNYFTKTEKIYVTTPKNSPHATSASGFVDVTFRTDGYGILTFQPYNSNLIYMTRRVNSPTWTDWVLMTPETPELNKRQPLGTLGEEDNKYTSVLQLPPGYYECTIPADAFTVDAPQDPNGSSYIAEIDVYEGSNRRKQYKLIANSRNDEYRATEHTNGDFRGWKKVQNEEEYNALFSDTGWIDWNTMNGATKRDTDNPERLQNQYRIIMTNGVKQLHLRINVNNIVTQNVFGKIPSEYVPKQQTFLARTPVYASPGIVLADTNGNLSFYVNNLDKDYWKPDAYIMGEFSWIIDDIGSGN